MYLQTIHLFNYRNYQNQELTLNRGINVLIGANGQGKTNLLEAIWSCTGCRSFRGAKEKDFIGLKAQAMHLHLKFLRGLHRT